MDPDRAERRASETYALHARLAAHQPPTDGTVDAARSFFIAAGSLAEWLELPPGRLQVAKPWSDGSDSALTPATLAKAFARVASGQRAVASAYWHPFWLTATWHRFSLENDGSADELRLQVPWWRLVRANAGAAALELFLEAFRRGASEFSAQTGYICLDTYDDPYQSVFRGRTEHRQQLDRFVFGYYWAMLLSELHCEVLGGRDRVLRDAPCLIREPVDPARVYLQLTDNPDAVSDEELVALREFLRPVLIPPYNPAPVKINYTVWVLEE